jgi:NADPH2:quinone reductase
MRALRVHALGKAEDTLVEEQIDAPMPGPGQVRVRVAAAALNFADDLLCRGEYQVRPELPFTPGMEMAGRVVACGEGANVAIGERVMANAALPHGAFAEEALAAEGSLYPAPDWLDDSQAAGMLVTYQTSYVALDRRAGLVAGETLLVHAGAGGVGSAAIQLGKALGARVIATAGGPDKVRVCEELGADIAIDYRSEDFVQRVNDATDGRGANVIYDPVGGDTFDRSRKCIAWEGRILVVGFASGRIPQAPMNHAMVKNYSLVGVHIGGYNQFDHAYLEDVHEQLMRFHQEGKIKALIHSTISLGEVPAAIGSLVRRGTVGKVIAIP